MVEHVQHQHNDESHKPNVVIVSNSVVQVGSVVVESFNSFISNISMPASWRSYHFAIRTNIVWISFREQTQKID
jgi:hypothetical protein